MVWERERCWTYVAWSWEATWTVCEAVATVSACGQRLVVSLDDEHLNMSRQPSDVSTASRM